MVIIPRNAYTHAPEQHPNLILGSLQILFWLIFRPTAFRNHLKRIDPALDLEHHHESPIRWRNPSLWRLFLQIYLILPLFINLIVGLVQWVLSQPVENIALRLVLSSMLSVILSLVSFGVGKLPILSVFLGFILSAVSIFASLPSHISFLLGTILGFAFNVSSTVLLFGASTGVIFSSILCVIILGQIGSSLEEKILSVVFGLGYLCLFQLLSLSWFGKFQWTWFFRIIFPAAFLINILLTNLLLSNDSLRTEKILNAIREILKVTNITLMRGIVIIVGITIISFWRHLVLFPFEIVWNALLYQLEKRRTSEKPSLLSINSAFWDEWQFIPLTNLERHIILVAKRKPTEAEAAFKYLLNSPQSWALKAAQFELYAPLLENCTNIETISNLYHNLVSSDLKDEVSQRLRIFRSISEDVDAALNQESKYNQRLVLKEITNRLNFLHLQESTRSEKNYAPRFSLIAQNWGDIITKYLEELAEETELYQELDSPYIIGIPLTPQQEIFIGRDDIGTRIEQLILDRRRPPLLLYGQRRMGKTSLLNNLGKLLPNNIIPMFVDLQGAPSSASNYAGFLYNLARGMITSAKKQAVNLPNLTRETLANDPFTDFDEWLDQVERALEQNTALLMLDEFEVLDSAITKGRFDEQDVLGMLRHLIQHRPRFKLMLAGSHTIEEYQRWASYLINVQVVHISYLKENEARQLIERPVKDFTLRYEPDAVERVLQLTRCHPFLVQLLCSEIVAYKNEQDPSVRRLAKLADVEAAVTEALNTGGFFFADIQNNQVDATGRDILRLIAAQGEGVVVSRKSILQINDVTERTIKLLLQRELIEEVGEGYRFQVEMIRQWFAQIK
ncbi:MAG: ATP-binding protein [Hapalosiphonaceae cyanobacterium JJU2]|nr:MAG: ATP-binding protein [Hapalosiphonaceae cyanobacterium JJU2]